LDDDDDNNIMFSAIRQSNFTAGTAKATV